ncbi:hypothetical protein [Pararhizobium sp. A13]|uniref:hypothetical protein n=1 Tax=Pararhizobium sp. A13 TaxID=3133975 RepID=UPI003255836E
MLIELLPGDEISFQHDTRLVDLRQKLGAEIPHVPFLAQIAFQQISESVGAQGSAKRTSSGRLHDIGADRAARRADGFDRRQPQRRLENRGLNLIEGSSEGSGVHAHSYLLTFAMTEFKFGLLGASMAHGWAFAAIVVQFWCYLAVGPSCRHRKAGHLAVTGFPQSISWISFP